MTSIHAITSLSASRDLQSNGIVAYVCRVLPAKIVDRVRINELKTIFVFLPFLLTPLTEECC